MLNPSAFLRPTASAIILGLLAAPGAALQVDSRPAPGAPLARESLAPLSGSRTAPLPKPAPQAVRPAAPAWSRDALGGESLAESRALFLRVDVDGDGRLDLRQADNTGIDGIGWERNDLNGDGALDFEEFCAARPRALASLGRSAAPDLIAESTRIQALWRARAARAVQGDRIAILTPSATAPVGLPPVGAPSPGAIAPPPGPAQARLSAAVDSSSAALTAERARRAQILLELRRRARDPDQER